MTEHQMPPAFLFGPPGGNAVSDEQRAAMAERQKAAEALDRRIAEQQVYDRRQILKFAPVVCTCRRTFERGGPPQHECMVHGALMLHFETGEVIL